MLQLYKGIGVPHGSIHYMCVVMSTWGILEKGLSLGEFQVNDPDRQVWEG